MFLFYEKKKLGTYLGSEGEGGLAVQTSGGDHSWKGGGLIFQEGVGTPLYTMGGL